MISGPDRSNSIANQQALQKMQPTPVVQPVPSTSPQESSPPAPVPQTHSDASQVQAEKTKSFDFENGSVSFGNPSAASTASIKSVGRIQAPENISKEAIQGVAAKLDLEFMSASFQDSLSMIETRSEQLHTSLLNAGVSEQELKNALNIAATMNGESLLS